MSTPARNASPATTPRPSLLPREHGAYGQLAMPLLTGLAVARPTVAAIALTAATVLAFVAHEPLLVVLGQRGKRLLQEEGPRARRLLAGLGASAAALGALGLWLAPPDARIAVVAPALLALGVAALVWRRLEKTAVGEVLVAATFATCGAVVALAGGTTRLDAAAVAAAWILGFAAATGSVRAVLLRIKTKGARDLRPLAAATAVGILGAAWAASAWGGLPGAVPLSVVPFAIASIAMAIVPIAPRQLKAVGWAIVATSVVALVVLVAVLRAT